MTYLFQGVHFLANYSQCATGRLTHLPQLIKAMNCAVEASGATLLKVADHVFQPTDPSDPVGYTCTYVLSESHASLHTYPEVDSCFVDLFTCGTKCDYHPFDRVLRDYLQPEKVSYQVVQRDTDLKILETRDNGLT